jgi:hypothetical protein
MFGKSLRTMGFSYSDRRDDGMRAACLIERRVRRIYCAIVAETESVS